MLHVYSLLLPINFLNETFKYIVLTKTTATQNEVALSYHRVRGLYFMAVVFVRSIVVNCDLFNSDNIRLI